MRIIRIKSKKELKAMYPSKESSDYKFWFNNEKRGNLIGTTHKLKMLGNGDIPATVNIPLADGNFMGILRNEFYLLPILDMKDIYASF